MNHAEPVVTLAPAGEADFEELVDIRIAAMRESLERAGRFNPVRARERLRSSFSVEHTRFIFFEEKKVGFYTARPSSEGLSLDHFYIRPEFQSRRIGSVAMQKILNDSDKLGVPVLVGALKGSASNRLYLRHGFAQTGEGEWDVYYLRPPPTK